MSKVIGFSFDEFKAKDTGDLIKGCTLYLGDERKDVTGLVAQRVFISEKKMGTYVPKLNDKVEVLFNRYGRVQQINVI